MAKGLRPITALVLLFMLACPAVAEQAGAPVDTQKIMVLGRSVVRGNDFAAASERALEDALNTALLRLEGPAAADDPGAAERLIIGHRILSSHLVGNLMTTRVEVIARNTDGDTALQRLAGISGPPRVAVVLLPGAPEITQEAVDTLALALIQQGYELLDRSAVLAVESDLTQSSEQPRAIRTAVTHRADVLIFARMKKHFAKAVSKGATAEVHLEVLCYDTINSKAIFGCKAVGKGDGTSTKYALDLAASRAGENVAPCVHHTLRSWWTKVISAGAPYTLRFAEVPEETATALAEALQGQPGVAKVALLGWQERTARFAIRFFGNPMDLQRAVNNACRQVKDLGSHRVRKVEGRYMIIG